MRKLTRLTENRLRKMIREAVEGVINEYGDTSQGQYNLGKLAGRYANNAQQASAENYPDARSHWSEKQNNVRHYAKMNGSDFFLSIKRKLDDVETMMFDINKCLLTETFLEKEDIDNFLGGIFDEIDKAKSTLAMWANGDDGANFDFQNGYDTERTSF